MKKFLITVLLASLASVYQQAIGYCQEATPDKNKPVLAQESVHEFACGPCAIINTLRFASAERKFQPDRLAGQTDEERAQTIIDIYGKRDSISYEGKQRYCDGFNGTSCVDLVAMFNDVLDDIDSSVDVAGSYLDRRRDESLGGHLRRIHVMLQRSIQAGMPVPFSIRSFGAKLSEKESKFLWYGLHHHYVAVVDVQDEIQDNEKGFTFEYVDSATGNREYGYMYFDEARNFSAAKGDSVNSKWVANRPFLLVVAPSLRLQTQNQGFHQRTIITANYGIFENTLVANMKNELFDVNVSASCGQCQFGADGGGCDLAIRYRGRTYFVDGTGIDDHGDAHAEDGLCNCIRSAKVTGKIVDGRFVASRFSLAPNHPAKKE